MIIQPLAYWIVVQSTTFLSADWCRANGLKFDSTEHFSIYLADGQEISAMGEVKCFVDLGPIKTEYYRMVLGYNPLLSCLEEVLGTMWSRPKQVVVDKVCA